MKFFDQTIFGNGEGKGEIRGNCLQACIANFLQVNNIDDVPHFIEMEKNIGDKWLDEFMKFMGNKGYIVLGYKQGDIIEDENEIWIGCGPAERGLDHSVLMQGKDKILYDPHPSKAGLLSLPAWGYRFERIK